MRHDRFSQVAKIDRSVSAAQNILQESTAVIGEFFYGFDSRVRLLLGGCHKNQSGRVIMVEVNLMSYAINPPKITSASTSGDQIVVIFCLIHRVSQVAAAGSPVQAPRKSGTTTVFSTLCEIHGGFRRQIDCYIKSHYRVILI